MGLVRLLFTSKPYLNKLNKPHSSTPSDANQDSARCTR